jgi:hypothetical protein
MQIGFAMKIGEKSPARQAQGNRINGIAVLRRVAAWMDPTRAKAVGWQTGI